MLIFAWPNRSYCDTLPDFIEHEFVAAHHDWSTPIAHVLAAEERTDGLWLHLRFHSHEEARKDGTRRVNCSPLATLLASRSGSARGRTSRR